MHTLCIMLVTDVVKYPNRKCYYNPGKINIDSVHHAMYEIQERKMISRSKIASGTTVLKSLTTHIT